MNEILLLTLIGIAAAFHGIYSGRAKADRFRAFPETLNRMHVRDWVILLIIVAGIFMLASTLIKNEGDAQKNSLKEQFNLSTDTDMLDFQQGANGSKKLSFSATVNFTPHQWEEYIKEINDPSFWEPKPLRRSASIPIPFMEGGIEFKGNIIDGDYEANARVWVNLPVPLTANSVQDGQINDVSQLDHIWWNLGDSQPKEGKIMCYMFQNASTEKGANTPWHVNDSFKVSACADLTNADTYYTYVVGILDYDKKTLRMEIR